MLVCGVMQPGMSTFLRICMAFFLSTSTASLFFFPYVDSSLFSSNVSTLLSFTRWSVHLFSWEAYQRVLSCDDADFSSEDTSAWYDPSKRLVFLIKV